MYTRDTHQKRADGTSLVHIQIVESLWNKQRKRSETHVVYDFGRADKPETIDRMKALAKTILRRCSLEAVAEASGMKLQFAWPFGDLFVFEEYWKRLGIPEAISMAMAGRQIEFSVERALFAMVANRACAPVSKLCCHEEWLREDVNIPGTECLGLHHLYRAMDFLEENQAAIEKKLYDNLSNLFNLDVELVFYDTTSIWFDIDEEDEPGKLDIDEAESSTSAGNALRKRGNAKDKRGEPQLVIGMVVTRDGFPVRHWVFPGNTVDVDTVAQVKADLKEWKLTRCVFVGDAGMVSAENLKKLAESGGKFIVCMSTGGKVVAACEKTEWGANVEAAIKEIGGGKGFPAQVSLLYAAKAPDLSSEVQSLLAPKPGTMLFASYGADAILMIKTLKSMKAKPKVIWGQNAGFESPEFLSTLGDDVEGTLTRTVFSPRVGDVKPVAKQVNEMYKKKTGRDLSGASARAFTGLQTWVYVLEKAGSTKPADIQKACNEIKIDGAELIVPWAGIKFATSGKDLGQNELGTGMIGQYQKGKDGKMTLEIVYPFDLATANMIYPIKGW